MIQDDTKKLYQQPKFLLVHPLLYSLCSGMRMKNLNFPGKPAEFLQLEVLGGAANPLNRVQDQSPWEFGLYSSLKVSKQPLRAEKTST